MSGNNGSPSSSTTRGKKPKPPSELSMIANNPDLDEKFELAEALAKSEYFIRQATLGNDDATGWSDAGTSNAESQSRSRSRSRSPSPTNHQQQPPDTSYPVKIIKHEDKTYYIPDILTNFIKYIPETYIQLFTDANHAKNNNTINMVYKEAYNAAIASGDTDVTKDMPRSLSLTEDLDDDDLFDDPSLYSILSPDGDPIISDNFSANPLSSNDPFHRGRSASITATSGISDPIAEDTTNKIAEGVRKSLSLVNNNDQYDANNPIIKKLNDTNGTNELLKYINDDTTDLSELIINTTQKSNGEEYLPSLVYCLQKLSNTNAVKVLKKLHDEKIDFTNLIFGNNDNLLTYAIVQSGDNTLIDAIINYGVDINHKNNENFNPLILSIYHELPIIFDKLIKHPTINTLVNYNSNNMIQLTLHRIKFNSSQGKDIRLNERMFKELIKKNQSIVYDTIIYDIFHTVPSDRIESFIEVLQTNTPILNELLNYKTFKKIISDNTIDFETKKKFIELDIINKNYTDSIDINNRYVILLDLIFDSNTSNEYELIKLIDILKKKKVNDNFIIDQENTSLLGHLYNKYNKLQDKEPYKEKFNDLFNIFTTNTI